MMEIFVTVFAIALVLAIASTVIGIVLAPRSGADGEDGEDVMARPLGDVPHSQARADCVNLSAPPASWRGPAARRHPERQA